jgi:hypothetical protein
MTTFEICEDGAGLWLLSCQGSSIRHSLRLERAIRLASRYASQYSGSCDASSEVVMALKNATITLMFFDGSISERQSA